MVPTYIDHMPEGTSTRPFVHYAQLYQSDKFESYDYGKEPMDRYTPTTYNLTKVTAPTAIFKGDMDDIADLKDISRLVSELPNVVFDHLVELQGYNHFDFIVSMDADVLVYKYILQLLDQF